ncbi:glycosyltransferase [Actinotalea ferrariae]|uniref:glycosyltransferase n=1 Tax=Actinotalea ferrariae TaxID=1386098 RepID=UPI001C8C0944|nr:glycosyltransferase [Actinotalea ferrariae]MBX9245976.1 glycosyltransferase [Actinotalea ferrariae]
MQLALAHDYLTQRGGAERVALLMTKVFPGAPLYTSVYNPHTTFDGFQDVDVRVSHLQKVPAFRKDPRLALLALPNAWDSLRPDGADVVVASSTGWAHGMSVPASVRKIVYCHNPARWLYQADEYLGSRTARRALSMVRPSLLAWDRRAARSADRYLVNSSIVARRVRTTYGIDAEVLHPPVSIDAQGEQEPVPGVEPGFWLTIARGRGYKNTHAVVEGTRGTGSPLVVAGSAEPFHDAPHVRSVGVVSDAQLRWLYANARALVSVSREDFGLTPLEANAFGTPSAVLRAGGFLDSTAEGVSGEFIETATADAVRSTLSSFPDHDRTLVRSHAARFSLEAFARRLWSVVAEVAEARADVAARDSVDLPAA